MESLPIKVAKTAHERDSDRVADQSVRQTFADLALEFAFFTPCLLVTHGGLDRDVLADFVAHNRVDKPLQPRAVACPFPVLLGVPDTVLGGQLIEWSKRLYMVPRAGWPALCNYVIGAAWQDPAKRLWARTLYTEVVMPDFIGNASGKPGVFRLGVFAPATNYAMYLLEKVDGALPSVVQLPPRVSEVKHAEQLFAADFSDSALREAQFDFEGVTREGATGAAEQRGAGQPGGAERGRGADDAAL